MKIVILSHNQNLYSTNRLIEAAESKDNEVRVVAPRFCYRDIASHKPKIFYKYLIIEHIEKHAKPRVNGTKGRG